MYIQHLIAQFNKGEVNVEQKKPKKAEAKVKMG